MSYKILNFRNSFSNLRLYVFMGTVVSWQMPKYFYFIQIFVYIYSPDRNKRDWNKEPKAKHCIEKGSTIDCTVRAQNAKKNAAYRGPVCYHPLLAYCHRDPECAF